MCQLHLPGSQYESATSYYGWQIWATPCQSLLHGYNSQHCIQWWTHQWYWTLHPYCQRAYPLYLCHLALSMHAHMIDCWDGVCQCLLVKQLSNSQWHLWLSQSLLHHIWPMYWLSQTLPSGVQNLCTSAWRTWQLNGIPHYWGHCPPPHWECPRGLLLYESNYGLPP